MKKALIELNLQFHTAEDLAKALDLAKFHLDHRIPMDDTTRLYCQAVFHDVIEVLEFYFDVCEDTAFDT